MLQGRVGAEGMRRLTRVVAAMLVGGWAGTAAAAGGVAVGGAAVGGVAVGGVAVGGAAPMARLIAARDWAGAAALAGGIADPVAGALVTYLRLLSSGGDAGEIEGFMARHAGWPDQAGLRRRRDEALAGEAQAVVGVPEVAALPWAAAALRVAAIVAVRREWVEDAGGPAAERRLLTAAAGLLDAASETARFERLVWTDGPGALRQVARLEGGARAAGLVWAALRRDEVDAGAQLAALGAAGAAGFLRLERAAWLRRTGMDDAALVAWGGMPAGLEAQGSAHGGAQGGAQGEAFWAERERLAWRMLGQGRNEAALGLIVAGRPAAAGRAEQALVAGWILLRRLGRPGEAGTWFDRLVGLSQSAVGQGAAHYWRGRAFAAGGDAVRAADEYSRAAVWATTFGGQMAARALGTGSAGALADPPATAGEALAVASDELARAAERLVAWGEVARARGFLLLLGARAAGPAEQGLAADLAVRLGVPEAAVAMARSAGRQGVVLGASGWPAPVRPPAGCLDPALVLGIARQESSFDPSAVSPAGARGLMQLMPGTALEVARRLGVTLPAGALTGEAGLNLALGAGYVDTLLQRFGGVPAYAAAAYNAGPRRASEWLAGAPTTRDDDALVDWIMAIPFPETRTYVQRVLENRAVYQAQNGVR